jgi:hypothetical protein
MSPAHSRLIRLSVLAVVAKIGVCGRRKYVDVTITDEDYVVERHFQQYFSYIVAVSFIIGEHRSTRRKPPTCRK